MKQLFSILFLLFVSTNIQAQLLEPILGDTMTLSQAKYELQREMATINYYYWQDYYGEKLNDRFRYDKDFDRRPRKTFELLLPDTISKKLNEQKWTVDFRHSNTGSDSRFYMYNSLRGTSFNKGGGQYRGK